MKEKILDTQKMEITTAEVYSATREITPSLQQLSDVSYSAMNSAVQQRLSQVTTWRNLTAGITAIALAFALALAWLVTRSLTQPLTQRRRGVRQHLHGPLRQPDRHQLQRRGRPGAAALDEMQGKLRTQIETERAVAAENTRIRQALDKASTSVVLADEQHQIIYVNDVAQASSPATRRKSARHCRTSTRPACAARASSTLSPDPTSQRRLLDNLTGLDIQERMLGEFTFRTVDNPVIGDQGERLGTVMEWSQRTQEVRVERELQTMLAAINGGNLGQAHRPCGQDGFFEAMSRGINQLADNMPRPYRW